MPAGSGLKLGGEVTLEAVLRAFYEGLQLATILCCIGAANALGSARRLLRYVPGALYEIGVACVIALTFAPQLVTDAARVRAAHRLRGRNGTGLRSLRAAGDAGARGRARAVRRPRRRDGLPRLRPYDGRGGRLAAGSRPCSSSAACSGVCIGVYGLLDGTASVVARAADAARGPGRGGARAAPRGTAERPPRYRPDPWALPEWLVSGCGVVAAAAVFVNVHVSPRGLFLAQRHAPCRRCRCSPAPGSSSRRSQPSSLPAARRVRASAPTTHPVGDRTEVAA